MNYTIAIKKQASKALANLPQDSYQKVRDGIRALADNPRPAGCLVRIQVSQMQSQSGF